MFLSLGHLLSHSEHVIEKVPIKCYYLATIWKRLSIKRYGGILDGGPPDNWEEILPCRTLIPHARDRRQLPRTTSLVRIKTV